MSEAHPNKSAVEPHPPDKFEFAFSPHQKGEPWWLTDGYGYGKEVGPLRWLYYRATRRRRTARFNRRIMEGSAR